MRKTAQNPPIEDVDCAVGERPCLDPGSAHGFAVDEAEVTFWGLCPACQAKRAEETAA
jgi:Fur family ferric uptake transcriptional regulator